MFDPLRSVGAGMVRDPRAIIAINPRDQSAGQRSAGSPRTWPRSAPRSETVKGRRPSARWAPGRQDTSGHTHRPTDGPRRSGASAPQGQRVPLPLAPPQVVGQGLQMLPALSLAILPPTGGEQRQMGRVRPMAPMRVEPRDGAPRSALPLTVR
jgi:hypothetical protein